jgi:hypothetical protein
MEMNALDVEMTKELLPLISRRKPIGKDAGGAAAASNGAWYYTILINPNTLLFILAIVGLSMNPSEPSATAPSAPPSFPPMDTNTTANFTMGITIDVTALLGSGFTVGGYDYNIARMLSVDQSNVNTMRIGSHLKTNIHYTDTTIASKHIALLEKMDSTEFSAHSGVIVLTLATSAVGFVSSVSCFQETTQQCRLGSCGMGGATDTCLGAGYCGSQIPTGVKHACSLAWTNS